MSASIATVFFFLTRKARLSRHFTMCEGRSRSSEHTLGGVHGFDGPPPPYGEVSMGRQVFEHGGRVLAWNRASGETQVGAPLLWGVKASRQVKEGAQGSNSNLRSARVEKRVAQGLVGAPQALRVRTASIEAVWEAMRNFGTRMNE